MSMRRRMSHDVPGLNTSSLPDLIFTVLFFFMIVTHMRQADLKVRFRQPQGTHLTRLTKKSTVMHVYIGTQPGRMGTVIQVNDKVTDPQGVADYVSAERDRMSPEDRQRMTVSIKADRRTPMAVITQVKQSLQQAAVKRISYAATEEGRK